MNGMDLLEAINEIPEQVIEKNQVAPEWHNVRVAGHRHVKWVAVAAAVLLCVSGVTAVAAVRSGLDLFHVFSSKEESGYDLLVEMDLIPIEELHGEITQLSEQFVQAFADYDLFSSWYPGSQEVRFANSGQALDYIGYQPLTWHTWELPEQDVVVRVQGDATGHILGVNMEVDYQQEKIFMQMFASLYTEHYEGSIQTGSAAAEYETYTEDQFVNHNQVTWTVISSSEMESGYLCKDAYTVCNDVLYQCHIGYLKKDQAEAVRLMEKWMELFG
ncbi:MAG: hypothetical protein IJV50_01145 [Lachnospiraceae bacterium]|nr:hypothetical protein [Lachnospiraceae bacterium]